MPYDEIIKLIEKQYRPQELPAVKARSLLHILKNLDKKFLNDNKILEFTILLVSNNNSNTIKNKLLNQTFLDGAYEMVNFIQHLFLLMVRTSAKDLESLQENVLCALITILENSDLRCKINPDVILPSSIAGLGKHNSPIFQRQIIYIIADLSDNLSTNSLEQINNLNSIDALLQLLKSESSYKEHIIKVLSHLTNHPCTNVFNALRNNGLISMLLDTIRTSSSSFERIYAINIFINFATSKIDENLTFLNENDIFNHLAQVIATEKNINIHNRIDYFFITASKVELLKNQVVAALANGILSSLTVNVYGTLELIRLFNKLPDISLLNNEVVEAAFQKGIHANVTTTIRSAIINTLIYSITSLDRITFSFLYNRDICLSLIQELITTSPDMQLNIVELLLYTTAKDKAWRDIVLNQDALLTIANIRLHTNSKKLQTKITRVLLNISFDASPNTLDLFTNSHLMTMLLKTNNVLPVELRGRNSEIFCNLINHASLGFIKFLVSTNIQKTILELCDDEPNNIVRENIYQILSILAHNIDYARTKILNYIDANYLHDNIKHPVMTSNDSTFINKTANFFSILASHPCPTMLEHLKQNTVADELLHCLTQKVPSENCHKFSFFSRELSNVSGQRLAQALYTATAQV